MRPIAVEIEEVTVMRQVRKDTIRSKIRGRGIDREIERGEIDRGRCMRETVEGIGAGEKTSASTVAITVVQKFWEIEQVVENRG